MPRLGRRSGALTVIGAALLGLADDQFVKGLDGVSRDRRFLSRDGTGRGAKIALSLAPDSLDELGSEPRLAMARKSLMLWSSIERGTHHNAVTVLSQLHHRCSLYMLTGVRGPGGACRHDGEKTPETGDDQS